MLQLMQTIPGDREGCVRMDNFMVALGVVFPMLAMMAVGVVIRRVGWVDEMLARQIDSVNFRVFLPCLVFMNIYQSDFAKDVSLPALAFGVGGLLIVLLVLLLIVPRLVEKRERISVICQAIFRGNFILFGMSITEYLYGEGGGAMAAVMSAVTIPVLNIASVILLEYYRPGGSGGVSPRKLLGNLIKNPLLIASLTSLGFVLLKIQLPGMVEDALRSMGRVATPMAFTMLGATLSLSGIYQNRKTIACSVLARMVLLPAVALPIACLLGFRGATLATLMVLFGSPSAVTSFTMAQQMGADGELAGQLVAATSVTALLSIFCITYVLQSMGLL